MSNVDTVFLIGAGFSYNVSPLVKDWSFCLKTFRSNVAILFGTESGEYLSVLDESIKFQTPDTFAKFIIARKDKERINKFKILIDLFISSTHVNNFCKEFYPSKEDKDVLRRKPGLKKEALEKDRYLNAGYCFDSRIVSFATEVIDELDRFQFLSWNYDLQLERSLSLISSDLEKLSLLHLNGEASFKMIDLIKNNSEKGKFQNLLTHLPSGYKNSINFAFESNNLSLSNKSIENIRSAKQLVVIGYSFPYYNNIYDKEILNKFLLDGSSIIPEKKIYIQDCDPIVIRERLKGFYSPAFPDYSWDDIVLIEDTKRFFIPPSLNQ